MKPLHTIGFVSLALPFLVGATDCEGPKAPKNEQAERAKAAAASITFTDNAEIDNIKRRLQLTANPGLQGFIVLLNETGQPVLYEGVHGKITSGTKRLTDPSQLKSAGNGNGGWSIAVAPGPSDEGTFGASDPYIYYWNQQDQYRQWNGKYLYSDKPIRLSIEPIVITEESKKK